MLIILLRVRSLRLETEIRVCIIRFSISLSAWLFPHDPIFQVDQCSVDSFLKLEHLLISCLHTLIQAALEALEQFLIVLPGQSQLILYCCNVTLKLLFHHFDFLPQFLVTDPHLRTSWEKDISVHNEILI